MITFGNDLLADEVDWPITANSAPFVQDLFDEAPVCEHDGCGRADLEAENPAVGF